MNLQLILPFCAISLTEVIVIISDRKSETNYLACNYFKREIKCFYQIMVE